MTREGSQAALEAAPRWCPLSYLGKGSGHRWRSPSAGHRRTRRLTWWWRSQSWWLQELSTWWGTWPLWFEQSKIKESLGSSQSWVSARGREQDISTAANICPQQDCDFPQSGPRGSKEHTFWGPVAKVGRSGPRYLGCGRGLALLGPPHWFSWCPGELQLLKSGVLEVTGSLRMAEI